jgi:predicted nucleic acid-binding protein
MIWRAALLLRRSVGQVRAHSQGRRPPALLTCWPVLTEAARLIRKRPDARPEIVQGFANGLFAIAPPDADDLAAIATIMRPYEDAGRQLADAALAHLAEREGIRTVFTLDGRDFSNIRLNRNRSLRLVPNMP